MQEQQTIEHLIKTDKTKAFNEIVKQYQERLYWHIRKIVIRHEDADDVLQKSFMKVWRYLDNFEGKSALYTWVYRIATNESINFLNQQKGKQTESFENYEHYLSQNLESDSYFSGDEIQRKLQQAILTLPEKQRIVFNMKYFDDLKYKIYNSINDMAASSHINKEITNQNSSAKRKRYKDAFDTEVMFIAEELRAISLLIDSGDISEEIFERIEKITAKVSYIVNGHLMSSKTIQKLINQLDIYFQNFNLEEIDISCIDGFEHLSRLLEDIAEFLDKYFISRQMDDIYVVEDSLKNSFEYVKLVFDGRSDSEDDDSEMEFF